MSRELLDIVKTIVILAPILGLWGLGLGITLRSGVVRLSTGQGLRRLVGNLSHTIVLVVIWVMGLAVLQQMVGFHLGLPW